MGSAGDPHAGAGRARRTGCGRRRGAGAAGGAGEAAAEAAGDRRAALLLRPHHRADRGGARLLHRQREEPDLPRVGHFAAAPGLRPPTLLGRDPLMTDELGAALHELAGSGEPGPLDVDKARRDGRRQAHTARLTAAGGSAAAVVAIAVAVSALPGGGAARAGADGGGTPTPAYSAPPLDPHDPIVTHWQFGYLPEGMTSLGGAGSKTSISSTTWAFTRPGDGFRMQIDAGGDQEPVLRPESVDGPTGWVPAQVAGARRAFWAGYGKDRHIVTSGDTVKNVATLHWLRADGHWLT